MTPGKYIGLSYEKLDCWDLVCAVFDQELDIQLGDRHDQGGHILSGSWVEIDNDSIQPYDVLLFSTSDLDKHVGLALERGKFLHSIAGLNSCIDSYHRSQWKNRLRKAYRHSQLMYRVV